MSNCRRFQAYLKVDNMNAGNLLSYVKNVLENKPTSWLNLTTHRLDIYNESLAKSQFLDQFELLFIDRNSSTKALEALPTAYDYIRLGHPLSCVLEWVIANLNGLNVEQVISFSSGMAPILAILRKNLLDNRTTQILYSSELPSFFDGDLLKRVYGYQFKLTKVEQLEQVSDVEDALGNSSSIFIGQIEDISHFELNLNVDFFVGMLSPLGSIVMVNGDENDQYISEIQHVRRRETIAMTPADCLEALKLLTEQAATRTDSSQVKSDKTIVLDTIKTITESPTKALVGSSGLSVQYAIMMGLVDDALENHKGKAIKFIVPPNCYGGTNDQARRVAACIDNVEVVDLPVDDGRDMVQSVHMILERVAAEDGVPYIIAEIPTNPRVEVPDLIKLEEALRHERQTANGTLAIDPVFILDQTFCPNVHFLGNGEVLSTVRTISYTSGSKFPSGGLCTAGYCVGNEMSAGLMDTIERHLRLCDNEATDFQYEILARQMPSMKQRIQDAYANTREFVDFIQKTLPEAKFNFVSEELAAEGFTPSVFSLDLPTKGNTDEERELYKRKLNHQLIQLMITEIPNESKHCVSYGQLQGCYWTIPATSTQGTTKEGDKDYIARVALSPDMDVERHKKVFLNFVGQI